MGHDELVAKINAWEYADYQAIGTSAEWPYKIIRAVVELHKPDLARWSDGSGCLCGNEFPCTTIQAIEKELI